MADETLTITIGQELISEIDGDRIAGAKSETPLEREEAVARFIQVGDEALVEKRACEFTKKQRTMDKRPKFRREQP
jgi:hypothetical protein